MDTTKKPTLLSLRQQTTITTEELALKADVSLTQAYIVEIGGFVDKVVAEKVIAAFSLLSGMRYTLNDIRLHNVSAPVAQRARLADLPTTLQPIVPKKK